MADLTISGVAEITATSGSLMATTTGKGMAGASISPGQALYADPTVNNTLFPAKATDAFQASHIVGIALTTAAINQPVTYAISGDITLSNANGVTSGTVYVLSAANAGGIAPITDSPTYVAVLGVGNGGTTSGSTNNFRLGLIAAPSLTGMPLFVPVTNPSVSGSSPSTTTNNATCTGRLTLTSGTPVTTSDVTAATTLYFTPYGGNQIALYNGSVWQTVLFSETSLSLSGLNANTAYDIFGYNNGGVLALESLAWNAPANGTISTTTGNTIAPIKVTSTAHGLSTDQIVAITGVGGNTAANGVWRVSVVDANNFNLLTLTGTNSTGNGTYTSGGTWQRADQNTSRATALSFQNGVYVKATDATRRYLGTIRITTTAGQCEDSLVRRFVWNATNRQKRTVRVTDANSQWTYGTAAWRPSDNSLLNRVEVVIGLTESPLFMIAWSFIVPGNSGGNGQIGIGLDAVSTESGQIITNVYNGGTTTFVAPLSAEYRGYPSTGYHYVQWLEAAGAGVTSTFQGAPNAFVQSGMTGELWA